MDPLLAAMMHGEIPYKKGESPKVETVKTPLQIEMEQEIDAYVDKMEFEEEIIRNGLVPIKVKREKLKLEMKEAAKLPKLAQQIDTAIALLLTEGRRYLSKEAFQRLESDFTTIFTHLRDIKLENVSAEDLQHLAGISDDTMQSIVEFAQATFAEQRYPDCLSLFSLLSILNPGNAEYWFRMGIAAQRCEDFELSCRSYGAASEIDPNHIGARVLAAECYARAKLLDEAKAELAAAKEIAAKGDVDEMWLDLLPVIEGRLTSSEGKPPL